MKISMGNQLKLGLLMPMLLVILLGIISYIQSRKHYQKTEALYSNALILERSLNMFRTSVISLHREMKDLSIDSIQSDIDIELQWIKWWYLRASGQIDTIYKEYTGPLNDIDSMSHDYIILYKLFVNIFFLMLSGNIS